MASETESLKNSFLSWKWQWLLDQRKQFNDRVDQYMTQLHDKFFTCSDAVREHQLIETALTFLSQPVPSIDTPIPQDEARKSVPETEAFERLQSTVKEQKDEFADLRAQTQEDKDKISSLEERLLRLDETTDMIQEDLKKKDDQQMKEMKIALAQLKKKQQKDRKTLSELKNSQKLALKACAQQMASLASSHKTTTTTTTTTTPAKTTQAVSGSGDKTPALSLGATSTPANARQPLAKRPKVATVLNSFYTGFTIDKMEVLSGGNLLFTDSYRFHQIHTRVLKLYNRKGHCLQSFDFGNTEPLTLIVIEGPLVAVIGLVYGKLHLMSVTEINISKRVGCGHRYTRYLK